MTAPLTKARTSELSRYVDQAFDRRFIKRVPTTDPLQERNRLHNAIKALIKGLHQDKSSK